MAAIIPSVMEAFRLSGGLKAGTPFEMASVPVIALQPPANARRTKNNVSGACCLRTLA
jgi:hypothetical protein